MNIEVCIKRIEEYKVIVPYKEGYGYDDIIHEAMTGERERDFYMNDESIISVEVVND